MFHEWKTGDPCPICGMKVSMGKMMDHARSHDPPTGLMFLSSVLYFHTNTARDENV